MTIMEYIDKGLVKGVTAVAIVILAISVFRIVMDNKRREASGIGNGISFLGGNRHYEWMRGLYITAGAIAVLMLCVHGCKKLFLGAYIPKNTIQFYAMAVLLFLTLIVQNGVLTAFRLSENGWYYCGEKHSREKCYYSFENTKLIMYSGESDSVVLEYNKEAEVKIPNNKKEETVKLLEDHYTKLPEGTVDAGAKSAKKFYITSLVWWILVFALGLLFINRGFIINEWEAKDVADGLEITGYNGNNGSVDIPEYVDGQIVVGIHDFGDSFFVKKNVVTSVFLPASIDRISGNSFAGYEALEQIYLPSSVQILGESVFRECPRLQNVTIYGTGKDGDVVDLSGTGIMLKEIHLIDCDVKDGMFSGYPYLESVAIDGNIQLAPGVFRNCAALKYVVLPDGMETISDSAFAGCEALRAVDLPKSIKTIGNAAFSGCRALESIELPDGVESIGNQAFEGCESLQHIHVPYEAKRIGDSVFSGSGIIQIAITGNVVRIPDRAFANCNSLQNVIMLDGIVTIGEAAFEGCESLQMVEIPQGIKTIGNEAFSKCMALQSIELPDSLEEIGYRAFEQSGITEITIPGRVSLLANEAFANMDFLQSVTLAEGMETISDSPFVGCEALRTVNLPKSIKTIGNEAFSGCGSLSDVELSDGIEVIGERAFEGCKSLQNVHLPDGLKEIGYRAFAGSGIAEITIPGNGVQISNEAFAECKALKEVILAEGMENVVNSMFKGCSSLQNIQMPDSVKVIEEAAFLRCDALENIEWLDGVEEIGARAFSECRALKNVELPDSLAALGEGAFKDCTGLETMRLPSSLQVIPEKCFSGCSALTALEIPEGYTEAASYAFYGCVGVESVTLPNSLKTIGGYAFSQMQATSVFLPDGLTQFSDTAFITSKLEDPVYLCHTGNSKITDQIKTARWLWRGLDAYELVTVKNREEYMRLYQDMDLLFEAKDPDKLEEVVYTIEDAEWADVQLDRMLEVDKWISYDVGKEHYTFVTSYRPMTLHFEKDGTGVLTEEKEESFTWKPGDTGNRNVLLTMDESGREYSLTFYSFGNDQLYLGLGMWTKRVCFFAK